MGGASGIEYFPFEDAEVWRICCTNWGDYNEVVITDNGNNTVKIVTTFYSKLWETTVKSRLISTIIADNSGGEYVVGTTKEPIGITINQIQAINGQGKNTSWAPFYQNSLIETFNEFQYFTGLVNMKYNNFFAFCTSLREISLPDNIVISGSNFLRDSGITSLTIPYGTTIFNKIVQGCRSLSHIELPESISRIENSSFYLCQSLSELTLPGSLTYIGSAVFQSCSLLRTFKMLATTPPEIYASGGSSGTFAGLPSDFKIYVPDSALNTYKTANKWSDLASRIYPLSDLD